MATEQSRAEATWLQGEGGDNRVTGYQRTVGAASTTGQDYEVALCSLFFLRARRICSDFYLASNYKLAGKFDDVVLFYRLNGDPDHKYRAIFLQAKHKTKLTEEQLTVKSPFPLIEYLESFKKIKHLWEKPLVVDGRKITLKNITIALFTNTGCHVGNAACEVTDRPEIHLLQDFLNTEGRLLRIPEAERVGLSEEPDISDFLGQLLLCVNQMSVKSADHFLQNELCRALKLTLGDVTSKLTSELKCVVKTWWCEEGKGRYLTPECEEWKKILQLLVRHLNADILNVHSNIALLFSAAALAEFDVKRRKKMTWITVKDTYQASVTRDRLISAQENFLALSAKYLKVHWEEVKVLWGSFCSTLAIELTKCPKDKASKLLQRVQEEAQNNAARHLVVIATDQPAHTGWDVVKLRESWSDLETDTKKRLLSVKVQLQGNSVLEMRDIVDSSVTEVMSDYVIKLLAGSESAIKIGDAMLPPFDYYVPRCLRRTSSKNINTETLENTNTLIFPNNYLPDSLFNSEVNMLTRLQLKSKDKIESLTIVRGRCWDSYIRKLCSKFGVKGIKGEMEKKYISGEVTEFIPFTWTCEDKVIVVEGVPGIGKSSYVTAMCSGIKKLFPDFWVLRVDLQKHAEFLKQADFTKTDGVIDFLLSALPKDQHSLERHLLKHALTFTGKVFLFLDAFDEISPEFTAKCCDLLKGIAHGVRFKQMVVTTRPVTTKDVEKSLGTQAFTLPVFNKAEQILFLKQFSVAKGKNTLQWEITSLRESAGPVIKIPLLCKMLAEVLLNRPDQSLLKYKDPWRRVLLYEHFVKQSMRHYISEKFELETWRPGRKNIISSTLKQHHHNLQGLAVRKLIPTMNISDLDVSIEEPDAVLGLVVNTGEAVNFEHRTFAEYFLGCWLSHHWRKCPQKILRDVFQQDGFELVVATFSWSLFVEFPFHVAVARGDVRAVKDQLGLGTIDHGGRSALHVAALTADNMEVSEVLVASGENLNIPDAVVRKTAARFAEVTKNWELIELMHKKGATLEDLKFFRDENAIKEVLINAVEKDLPSLLKYILNMHRRYLHSHVDVKGNTLLHIAAAYNCIRVLELLIDMKHSVNVKNFEGNTPLHGLSVVGSVEAVRLLVDNGADPSIGNDQGDSPLKLAVSKDKLEIVKIFIETGLDKDARKKYRETAMLLAASEGKLEIIKLLIKKGVDTFLKDNGGKTTLTLAARRNHLDVAELLINSGKRNINDEDGREALTLAARGGHTEMVKLLERHGVTTDRENKNGNIVLQLGAAEVDENVVMSLPDVISEKDDGDSALLKLAFQDNLDIVKLVIQRGSSVNKKNGDEVTAFSWADLKGHLDVERSGGPPSITLAAYKGRLKVLKLLVNLGGDVNVRDHEGETALTWAAGEGNVKIVKLLIEYEADINVKNKYGDTSLILATRKGHEVIVKLLIESGADIDIKDENGYSALTLAAKEGRLEVVRTLIDNVDETKKKMCMDAVGTVAVREGHVELISLLIERRFEPDIEDENGDTALTVSASEGHVKVVEVLLKEGLSVNFKNYDGNTAGLLAASNGHKKVVKLLLDNGSDVNTKNRYGNNAFALAARNGRVNVMKLLIERGAETNIKDVDGNSVLMLAAAKGHLNVVKFLHEKGFDVNIKNNNEDSALTLAASEGHLDVVTFLLDNGSDVNTKNKYGNNAFTFAAGNGRLDVMKLLIERGAETNIKDVEGNSALMLAAAKGHLNVVKFLHEKGFDVNIKNSNEDSALTLAASEGHLDVVTFLLDNGSDVNTKNRYGNNAFTFAARNGRLDVMKLLIERGAETNIKSVKGNSALMLAAAKGHQYVVRFLLERGFDVTMENNNEESALTKAASAGHLDVVMLLLENGCDINTKNKNNENAFTIAASEGHLDVVKLLLENGSDVNMINIYGQNAFHLAAFFGHLEVVQFLIESEADTDIKDDKGNSALMLAAKQGHLKVVKFLLEKGFDLKLKNNNEESALTLAATEGHLDVVKLLLENVSDVKMLNICGQNAFHWAVFYGHLEVVKILFERGVESKLTDVDGNSALMLAARKGHFKVVKFLLSYGCDIKLKNKNGHTALQLAAREGHNGIVKLLKEKESDTNILESLCCFMEG